MKDEDWQVTTNRFVAFFDILGFKDLVNKNNHQEILKKLSILKKRLLSLENKEEINLFGSEDSIIYIKNHTKSATFSDSIIIFSKSQNEEDIIKIITDCYYFLKTALVNKISIKGAISFGEITADFKNNLFFGQALIDSYLLHEDLEMINVIIDHKAYNRIIELDLQEVFKNSIVSYKTPMKYGKVTHNILKPKNKFIDERIELFNELFNEVSGKPRKYIDNTIEFLNYLKPKNGK